jgi:hypothetical protein
MMLNAFHTMLHDTIDKIKSTNLCRSTLTLSEPAKASIGVWDMSDLHNEEGQ